MTTINDEAVNLLSKLVSIPSPSRFETNAVAFLVDWMNTHGLTAHIDEAGNAVGVRGDGPHEILLLGHIDTFPGEVPVRREGDLLYGRGSVDAKGPLCTFAAAVAQTPAAKGWRMTVVGAVEEEAATSKGARHILKQRRGRTVVGKSGENTSSTVSSDPPKFCIIGEPSNWDRITLGYKGRLLLEAKLRVPFSHSAGEGRLPAEQAVDFWKQIEDYCRQSDEEREASSPFSRLDPSLRHIISQDEGSFGSVQLNVGFRLPVGISPADIEQDLRGIAIALPEDTGVELQFSGGELAYRGGKANALVRAFLPAIRAHGGKPRFVSKTGTADMNVVGPHWPNTPIVAYGPGDSRLDHTPNEHIDLNEYSRAINILADVLQKLPIVNS